MDTLDLAIDEIGVYCLMLMLAWHRDEAGLPDDMKWLKRSLQSCAAGFHGHTFNRIVPKLLDRYFKLSTDGVWRNKRLTKERIKADKMSANGRQMADKRWGIYREINAIANAKALPITITKKEGVDENLEIPACLRRNPPVREIVASEQLTETVKRKGWS